MSSFSQLDLSAPMRANLEKLGFYKPTPVQAGALPPALAGKDVIAQAQTGSGKTAAFGIPVVEQIDVSGFSVQALVLCPTRELADQVSKALRELARAKDNLKIISLCGGVSIGPQIGSLSHGAHVVVGTPGRIQDHLRKGTLKLNRLKMLILDEADRMLDMGFEEAVEDIIGQCPSGRQTLMFSATWPKPIRALSERYQKAPADVRIEQAEESLDIIEIFYEIAPGQQMDALSAVLSRHQPDSCIAFCNTKQQCDEVAATLNSQGFSALPLHGDLEQRERDSVLVRFGNKSCSVLVATDVAARGLDIKSLPLVVNVEPARDSEVHTHRIGRTGRAGEQGLAITLCTPAQSHKINRLETHRKSAVEWGNTTELMGTPLKPTSPVMTTLCIAGGRKDKVRPGDVLGALTGEAGIPGNAVGKIDLFDFQCFVAIQKDSAATALKRLENGRIKGRKMRVRYA